jgi:hypothetical protein
MKNRSRKRGWFKNVAIGFRQTELSLSYTLFSRIVCKKLNLWNFRPKKQLGAIFRELPRAAVLFLPGLLQLFHKIAFAITMERWLVTVNAEVFCDVITVQLKTRIHK